MKAVETITVNWNDVKSIKAGERKKVRLENAGYTIVNTRAGITISTFTYKKGET